MHGSKGLIGLLVLGLVLGSAPGGVAAPSPQPGEEKIGGACDSLKADVANKLARLRDAEKLLGDFKKRLGEAEVALAKLKARKPPASAKELKVARAHIRNCLNDVEDCIHQIAVIKRNLAAAEMALQECINPQPRD